MNGLVVALDVGGTSVKSALVDAASHTAGDVQAQRIDSLGSASDVLAAFAAILRREVEAAGDRPLLGVGVGFPGPFDYERGICLIQGGSASAQAIAHAGGRAKYESLYGLDLAREFRARLGGPKQLGKTELPIRFANDAAVAILGEARYGAGHGRHRLIGVTLGTGLGSAFLVDGRPVEDGDGVPAHGWLYAEPFEGAAADELFSARGLRRRWQAAGLDFPDARAAALAARAGDPAARQAFETFGAELGRFLTPYAARFAAEAVLVLGGLSGAYDLLERSLAAHLSVPAYPGALGPRAPLLGAADTLINS